MDGTVDYGLTRLVFQRGLGLVYLIAFIAALNQFRALLGEHGLLPAPTFIRQVPFSASPSLFYLWPKDSAFMAAAWVGVVLSCLTVTGLSEQFGLWVSMGIWTALWMLYMSFVNVGQTFYAFGWESILLEAGFYAIFLGSRNTPVPKILIWCLRWELFRIMFGAGLIKLRGDPCWRNLSCLDYHYETQPMPNGLSWYFHWAPEWTHKAGVAFNHVAELAAPIGYFLPSPVSAICGIITLVFQGLIMASGNLSFLNLLTMVLSIPLFNDRWLRTLLHLSASPVTAGSLEQMALRLASYGVGGLVLLLSIQPAMNMISPNQIMNTTYNSLHLVGTYGAFGSVTRTRYEVVIEGTDAAALTPAAVWKAYEFKGKPGDLSRRPPQIAPYHLRIDWLMWFAAMGSYEQYPWFINLVAKLLQNDPDVLGLLDSNPFPGKPPHFVRAEIFEYHFTTPEERRLTGQWWTRRLAGEYFPPMSMDNPSFRHALELEGWL